MFATPDSKRIGGMTFGQLDRFNLLGEHGLHTQLVARIGVDPLSVVGPLGHSLFVRQVPFDGFAER